MPSYTSTCVAVFLRKIGGDTIEHPAYRDNLEQILKFTGGKQVLTVSQVREFTGMVDSRTIRRHFPIMKGATSAPLPWPAAYAEVSKSDL